MDENVLGWTYQARSDAEAKNVAEDLKLQMGCIYVDVHGSKALAYFDIHVPEGDVVPDGCRLVPRAAVEYLQQREKGGNA